MFFFASAWVLTKHIEIMVRSIKDASSLFLEMCLHVKCSAMEVPIENLFYSNEIFHFGPSYTEFGVVFLSQSSFSQFAEVVTDQNTPLPPCTVVWSIPISSSPTWSTLSLSRPSFGRPRSPDRHSFLRSFVDLHLGDTQVSSTRWVDSRYLPYGSNER